MKNTEQKKILTISKEELYNLGTILGLKKDIDRKSMRKVLNTLIKKSKEATQQLSNQNTDLIIEESDENINELKTWNKGDSGITEQVDESLSHDQEVMRQSGFNVDFTSYTYQWTEYDLSPSYSSEWYLQSKELLGPSQVEDWYNGSKLELFRKMSIMTATQMEPKFPPQYVWETYTKNGEEKKVRTYIIVWDMHMDEYNIWNEADDLLIKKILSGSLGKSMIFDEDESSDAEINSVSIIHDKFWITNIWLENISYNTDGSGYWIADWLKEKDIPYYGLEGTKNSQAEVQVVINSLILWLKVYQTLGIDLHSLQLLNKEEFIELWTKHFDSVVTEAWLTLSSSVTSQEQFEKLFLELERASKQDLKEFTQCALYMMNKLFWSEVLEAIMSQVWETMSADELKEKTIENIKMNYKLIIKERNTTGLKYIDSHMKEEQVWLMVYWKAHIANLIDQLNNKYDWNVNIYVAK